VKLLIKNGRVVDPASGIDDTLDILIANGKIVDIKTKIKMESAKLIDAARLVVAPGFIDMHTHLREPGKEDKETIKSGSAAAAKGGFTSIACMPNTSPVNDTRSVTEYIISEAKKNAITNVFPIAAITKGQKGEELTEMGDIMDAGAIAFSDDGNPVHNSQVMRLALEYSKPFDALIIDHCEDMNMSGEGVMHEGYYSYLFGLSGIPSASEEVMVARDIILAQKTKSKLHLAHISTKGSANLLRNAKQKKVQITAEVTPHHLLLTDASIENYDTSLKVNPPLRSKDDVAALREAIKDGIVDVFASDHAPHTPDEKAVEFNQAPFGINGLETFVSLLLDRFVNKKVISLKKMIKMISTRPAQILEDNDHIGNRQQLILELNPREIPGSHYLRFFQTASHRQRSCGS
jgi:dihydroorotase